jgi:hypothetical protein
MTDIGPHLLGRIPSPPDARDWKLSNLMFLTDRKAADPVALATTAEQELKQTTVSYPRYVATKYVDPTATHWYRALDALNQIIGNTPVPPPPAPSGVVLWTDAEAVLDQGNYGTCVGNGCAQWGNTLPVDDKFIEGMGVSALKGGPYARAIYYEATVLDGSPDNPDASGGGQQGATVRSGVKALKNRGRMSAYASATLDDAITWILTKGPIIFGTDWTNDMFNPDANGYVTPTGGYAGGHCFLGIGVDPATDDITFLNSWSDTWGVKGTFKMTKPSMATLMASQGEAWAAVELPLA